MSPVAGSYRRLAVTVVESAVRGGASIGKPQKKSLDTPDERFQVEGLAANIVQMGDASVSLSVFEPGAHCALGGRKMIGNFRAEQSCLAHHTGVVLEGRLRVEMDDGSSLDLGPNDVYEIPPGHDGWVIGAGALRAINWSGVRTWLPETDESERVVVTLLVTDIVGSTEFATRIGDAAWRELLADHNREVRGQLDRYRGREVNTTGDGFLAVFDGAARAIRAAVGIRDRVRALGLEVRIGVHTGEVEMVGDDVRGTAVHEAARVAADTPAGEIFVSATTYQLASGSGFEFQPEGEREFKGISGPRSVYSVA